MAEIVRAQFVDRPNRFVVRARLDDGSLVEAHLPNTGRLTHLTEPDRPFILRRDGFPPRVTEYTAIRAWDGCWVALEASRAPVLLEEWLNADHPMPGVGAISDFAREVTIEGHRLDLRLTTDEGATVWVEVKSGGRAEDGVALLSATPSTRGASHLAALGRLVAAGEVAVAAFVIQRPDVRALRVGEDADPGWIDAVRAARSAGVAVLAYGCAVTEEDVCIDRELPILWDEH